MQSLYSKEARNYIHTRKWPSGLVWEIIEYKEYLGFKLYRDNFNLFDGDEKRQIAMMVKEVMEKIRADGIPIYMEVAKGDGRRRG